MISRRVRLFLTAAGALLLTLLLNLLLARTAVTARGVGALPQFPMAVSTPVTVALPFVNKPIEPFPPVLLGTLPAPFDYSSFAVAINDRGQVVGVSNRMPDPETNAMQSRAFLWQNGVMTSLGTLGGPSSSAVAISARGEVIGSSTITDGGPEHAFFWAGGVMTDLGTLGGGWSAATAINDQGQVAGASAAADGSAHAFIWADGVMTDLGTLGGTTSRALDINDRGQVVGSSMTASAQYEEHAFVWANGVMADLGLSGNGSAVAINARGQVAGVVGGSSGHGFLWENGAATYFGNWPNNVTRIDGLNDAGQIVGYLAINFGIEYDAFVWSGGALTPLKTYAFTRVCPVLIDNAGAIVAIDWDGAFILRNGLPARLAGPDDESFSCARAINDRGQVVGSVRIAAARQGAALWDTAGE